MNYFHEFIYGLSIAFQPWNLLSCFFGVFIGTLIGVLPGIGPVGTIALLLPLTFGISPVTGIIMLAGIYYGAMYGGSTTSILVNIPGEASSVVTCLDGHQMALKGRAGPALGISAFGSFIAGTISVMGLMFVSNTLAEFAVKFGPAEYFSLMCLGLSVLIYLTQGSVLRGLVMGGVGVFLSLIGQDSITGKARFTFGLTGFLDGIGLVPLVMGLFGISEILLNLEKLRERTIVKTKIKGLYPNREDWRRSGKPIARGTLLGFCLGMVPGVGGVTASFVSYAVEKRFSKNPEQFGKGAIEGVAGPESANNAATGASLIPMFSLGIPSNIIAGLLLGALMIHGITPGPLLLTQHPEVFWGVVASMYLGNAMLLILNLPLIWMWVKILEIPYKTLFPLVLLFCIIGSYSVGNNVFDIFVMLFFGVLGYLLRKLNYEPAPLALAYILGPILEVNLRQALIISDGSGFVFLAHPLSAGCLIITFVLLFSATFPSLQKRRKAVVVPEK